MKKFNNKQLISTVLIGTMIISNCIPAFAVTTVNTIIGDINVPKQEETEVIYNQSSTYFVTIPKQITLDSSKESTYSVKVEGDISSDQQVYVAPIDGVTSVDGTNFYMKDQSTKNPKADVLANVTSSKQYWNFIDVSNGVESNDNSILASKLTAGTWKGTFDFEINMHKVIPSEGFVLSTDGDVVMTANSELQVDAYKDGQVVTDQVQWESDNSNVRVDNGLITTSANVKVGDVATITATAPNTQALSLLENTLSDMGLVLQVNAEDATKATLNVTIVDIELSKNEVNIAPGERDTVTARILPIGMTGTVSWSSTTNDITLNRNGNEVTIIANDNAPVGNTYYIIATYDGISSILKVNIVNSNHTHSYVGVITKEPTYTETGIMTYTCECGDSYTEEIPMLKEAGIQIVNGKEFNTKIKQLVSTSATYETSNTKITSIELTNVAPTTQATKNVGISEDEPVLAYLDGTVVKLYTKSNTLVCNEDSSYMFANFRELINIDILNNLDTSNVTNMSYMFYYCGNYSMLSLDLGLNFDTSKVTDMSYMFNYCGSSKMTSLDLGNNFDTSNVINMSNMFSSCGNIKMSSLNLGDKFDTSNVTDMSSMFASFGSKLITSLDLGDKFNTSKVTDMSYMFAYCGHLSMSSLNLGDKFDTSSVTNMERMFFECGYTSMTSLDLGPNFNTFNVTNMSYMFYKCGYTKMTSLNLGENFNTSKVTTMNSMFSYCGYTSMTSLDLGNKFNTSKVINMNDMFYYCGYTAMTTLNLGENFNTSKVTTMSSMFQRCGYTKMTSLDLGDKFDTSSVTNMMFMFGSCGYMSMTTLDLGPNFNTFNVKGMSHMFNGCGYEKMTSLDLRDKFDTSKAINMEEMFSYCGYTSMTSLDLGDKFDTSNVTYMGNMFSYCGSTLLTSLDLGAKFNMNKVLMKNSGNMFYMAFAPNATLYVPNQTMKTRVKSSETKFPSSISIVIKSY